MRGGVIPFNASPAKEHQVGSSPGRSLTVRGTVNLMLAQFHRGSSAGTSLANLSRRSWAPAFAAEACYFVGGRV